MERRVDDLGRLVIPKEIRRKLSWGDHARIDIIEKDGHVELRLAEDACAVCGSEPFAKHPKSGKHICFSCLTGFVREAESAIGGVELQQVEDWGKEN